MNKIPFGTYEIYLDPYGYHDEGYSDGCFGVQLIARTPVNNVVFWESGLYDSHPDEYKYSLREIKNSLIEAFNHYGLNTDDIVDFDQDCVWDWEYDKNVGL